ncbi:MAG: hypothetical protein ABSG90_14825 [Dehalococcoidia bacterium]
MNTSLVQLQEEVVVIRHELEGIKKKLNRPILEPIIIEGISERELTPKEKKHLEDARADLKAGRMSKFVTLDEAEKMLNKKRKN